MSMQSFAELVIRARNRLGLSQEKLAQLVGVTSVTIWRIENGASKPSLEVAFKLTDVLGLNADTVKRVVLDQTAIDDADLPDPAKMSEEEFNSLMHALDETIRRYVRRD